MAWAESNGAEFPWDLRGFLEANSNCCMARESQILWFKFSGFSQADIVRGRLRAGFGELGCGEWQQMHLTRQESVFQALFGF